MGKFILTIINSLLLIVIIVFIILIFNKGRNFEALEDRNKNHHHLILENQQYIIDTISKVDVQCNTKFLELSKTAQISHKNLRADLVAKLNLTGKEIREIKKLLGSYRQEIQQNNTAEHINSINTTVDSDYFLQQLLTEGFVKYQEENYTEAVTLYKQILDIKASHTEALCYLNASLYYQNPGDGDNFPNIKQNLISLLEGNELTNIEKKTALEVLRGISMEEGNTASMVHYQNSIQELGEGE